MVKSSEQMKLEIREQMRGGNGHVEILHWLEREEYNGKARLLAKITLHEGCSIGAHEHNDEEEIFYIISGTGIFDDNGTQKPIKAGDVTVTTSGQSHSIANTGSDDLVLVAAILTY